MDYSLLVGIHDTDAAASGNGAAGDQRNNSFDNDPEDVDIDEEGTDEDSPGSGGAGGGGGEPTPPDSPVVTFQAPMFSGDLDESFEFYAKKGNESKYLNHTTADFVS
jgi:hypothetical protein